MKNKMLKLLSLALVLSLTFAFTGCGDSEEKNASAESKEATIVGQWVGSWSMEEIMNQQIGAQDPTMAEYFDFSSLEFEISLKFTEDEVTVSVTEESVEAFVDDVIDVMEKGMKPYFEAMAKESGIEIDDLVSQSGYGSVDEMIGALMEQADYETAMKTVGDNIKSQLSDSTESYKLDGNKIVINENEEWEYKLDNNKLEVTINAAGMVIELDCNRK